MNINVEKTLFNLTWKNYKLEVSVEHGEQIWNVLFMIDGNVVVERKISGQETAGMTDADVIHAVVDQYILEKQAVDKYSDIIVHHSHEMQVINKQVTYSMEYYGARFVVVIEITDNAYHFMLSNDKTKDFLEGSFEAKDVSEVLEKFRIYLRGGVEISRAATEHLDMLVNQHPLIR